MKAILPSLLLFAVMHMAIPGATAQNVASFTVDAKANIFGAGKTVPPAPAGEGGGELPVEVDLDISSFTSVIFTSVTGQIACCVEQEALNGPDGGTYIANSVNINSFGGISGIIHDNSTMFLVGVFLDDTVPSDPAPVRLRFSNSNDFLNLSPALNQTFFIGDGKSQDGELQSFIVPTGATRLFLGFVDGLTQVGDPGYYRDNHGELVGIVEGKETDRMVSVFPSEGVKGGKASVPVEFVSEGVENSLKFSLAFNTDILTFKSVQLGQDIENEFLDVNESEAPQGRLGIEIALSSEQTLQEGLNEILVVDFEVEQNAEVESTQIEFADQPVMRAVANVDAENLPVRWQSGSVILLEGGLESDVSPAGQSDGIISLLDWIRVGDIVSGIESFQDEGNEFQRVDAAPRWNSDGELVLGDGRLSIIDWVQAGRYQGGLDPSTVAGGPVSFVETNLKGQSRKPDPRIASVGETVLYVSTSKAEGANSFGTSVSIDANGNESGVGFSLEFDPSEVAYENAVLGSGASGAKLNVNDTDSENGRIGFALAFLNATFDSGIQEMLEITFQEINPNVTDSTAIIIFGDIPVEREISDSLAMPVRAEYDDMDLVLTDVEGSSKSELNHYRLGPNYPNPVMEATSIEYFLPVPSKVTLQVFNLLGQEVEKLVDAFQNSGNYVVNWRSTGYENGVYFYRLTAGDYRAARKLTVLR